MGYKRKYATPEEANEARRAWGKRHWDKLPAKVRTARIDALLQSRDRVLREFEEFKAHNRSLFQAKEAGNESSEV
jgi:hypothetical protein